MIFDTNVIGSDVFKILNAERLNIHSVFNKGFNIINEHQELIFVGTAENGLFPFGINVDAQTKMQLLDDIQVGSEVKMKHHCLYFSTHIVRLNGDVINFKDRFIKNTAFIDELKKIDFSEYEDTDFNKQQVDLLLTDLTSDNDEGMLRYFIGRGSGLTPTGDDILVGMLFVHSITPFITPTKRALIKKILQEDCTTLVSKQFLNLALEGVFSSRLTDLLNESNPSLSMMHLLNVGSSSGKDTAYGIFSAI